MEQVVRGIRTRCADAGELGANAIALLLEYLAKLGRPHSDQLPLCTQQSIADYLPAASIARAVLQVWRGRCRVKI